MRFDVEPLINPKAFRGGPVIWSRETAEAIKDTALHTGPPLTVEAENSKAAADEVFRIANSPDEPTDADGTSWPHFSTRSLSSGDVVAVRTPDGDVFYLCLSIGWMTVPREWLTFSGLNDYEAQQGWSDDPDIILSTRPDGIVIGTWPQEGA